MKGLAKAVSAFVNLANYGVGIAVAVILVFKLDTISIFYVNSMTSNESLFFNMIMFQIGLALAGVILCLLVNEYVKSDITVEFPVIYAVLPIIISAVSIFYGISGETVREKILVCACAIVYAVLSVIIVYCGSRVFQVLKK